MTDLYQTLSREDQFKEIYDHFMIHDDGNQDCRLCFAAKTIVVELSRIREDDFKEFKEGRYS